MTDPDSGPARAELDGTPCRVAALDLAGARLVPAAAPAGGAGRCRLCLRLPTAAGELVAETTCRCRPRDGAVIARFHRPNQAFIQRLAFYLDQQAQPS